MKSFLKLDYNEQKLYIKKLFMENPDNTFLKITNEFIHIFSQWETEDYAIFKLYLNILSDLYDENCSIFYKNELPIFYNKQDLGLFLINCRIQKLEANNNNEPKLFFEKVLNDLNIYNINSLNIVEGDKSKGFCFDYLLYIPTKLTNSTLIIEGNNSATDNSKGKIKDFNYVKDILPIAGSFQYFLDLDAPIFIPLIPSDNCEANFYDGTYHEKFARQLSRNTVNPSTNKDELYRMDLQILNAIDDAKNMVYNKTGVKLEEKSLLYGFSTAGNLATRLAFLHPNNFCGVIAGGINAAIPVPLKQYRNVNLIYPVGIFDYEQITGRKFDYNAYMSLPQYYFMGDSESQEDYNTVIHPRYYDLEVTNTYTPLSLDLYERAKVINDIYKNLSNETAKIEIFEGFGHTPLPAEKMIKEKASLWINESQMHHQK